MSLIEFRYRGFYDVPRYIVIRLPGGLVLLESRFDDDRDDYDDHYTIYQLPLDVDLSGSWVELANHATARLGRIAVTDVVLDPTRRRSLELESLRPIVPDALLR